MYLTAYNFWYIQIYRCVILLSIYYSGIVFCVLKNIYSIIKIFLLSKKGRKEKINNKISLIIHKHNIAPFSWMNYIVINEDDLLNNPEMIISHEMAHIKNRHSFDLLFLQLFSVFQWFNPVVWLVKNELQTIHEYEADNSVINSGIDAKTYQLLLIKKAVGIQRFNSITNSFNHSKLKKRITMMLKEKSSPWARLKYLLVLPLSAVMLTAFAQKEISQKINEISRYKVIQFSSKEGDTLHITNTIIKTNGDKADSVVMVSSMPVSESENVEDIYMEAEADTIQLSIQKAKVVFYINGKYITPEEAEKEGIVKLLENGKKQSFVYSGNPTLTIYDKTTKEKNSMDVVKTVK